MTRTYVLFMTTGGVPQTLLNPAFIGLYQVSDGTDLIGSAPTITELGTGLYKFTYDASVQAAGVIDCGATQDDVDRYIPIELDPGDEVLNFIRKVTKGKKDVQTSGGVSTLLVIDPDDDLTVILNKVLHDQDGNDITELVTGQLSTEEKSTV